jgi:hypothetical protein
MANEALNSVGQLLLATKEDVQNLLSGTEHGATASLINHQLDQLINRVAFLGGNAPVSTATTEFPPITEFMGEPINRAEPITEAQLAAGDLEKQIFTDKVEALYDNIEAMFPDKVLNSYTIPEDVLVLRGVAKKAGVPDYSNAPLNVAFVEAIHEGIAKKREEELKQQQFEETIEGEDLTTKPSSPVPAPGVTDGPTAGQPTSETTTVQTPAPSTRRGGRRS